MCMQSRQRQRGRFAIDVAERLDDTRPNSTEPPNKQTRPETTSPIHTLAR